MAEVATDGLQLFVDEWGDGRETVVFSHSYLVDHRHFGPQIEALASDGFRVLAYDHRDHGRSGASPGAYDLEAITRDGLAVLEHVGGGPVHWVGLSTGGFVGLRIALRRPEALRSLVLASTTAEPEIAFQRTKYRLLLTLLRLFGYRPVLGQAMKAMFSPSFLRAPAREEERKLWASRMQEADPAGLVRFGRAIFWRDDLSDRLGEIEVPTLVIHGEEDAAIPLERARRLAAGIPRARLEILPGAGHLCSVDAAEATTRALRSFLSTSRTDSAS